MNCDGVTITEEWGKAESPADINSGSMSSGVVVGIYDTKKRIGYMFETVYDCDSWGGILKFCKWVLKLSYLQDVTICIVGGSYSSDESKSFRKSTYELRIHSERTVRKWFPKVPLNIKWGEPNISLDLTIDTLKGDFLINEEEMFEFDDETLKYIEENRSIYL